jgi:hypothetical protein
MSKDARSLLQEIGAVKLRQSRHEIWQLPNGRRVSLSVSASDKRANQNQIKDIKRAMQNNFAFKA